MTLLVQIPRQRWAPLSWVVSVVLRDFLGLEVEIAAHDRWQIVITDQHRSLELTSCFPDLAADWELQRPRSPLACLNLAELGITTFDDQTTLPVLFGQPSYQTKGKVTTCEIDIFGSVFFMLSRFEEVNEPQLDRFERFSAVSSLAFIEGFLARPIVDEYVDLLWSLLRNLWPNLSRTPNKGAISISCDVDQPFDRVGTSISALFRGVGGDLVHRKSPRTAVKRSINFVTHRSGNLRYDPFYTFDWYLDACEQSGHSAAFYFIADHSGGEIDGNYDIFSPRILRLMRHIHDRGHEIGMHGSFNTFRSVDQIRYERERLTLATQKAGIPIQILGNRQHYLRWDASATPDALEEAGFAYDTSGGFADRPGFRYGTARTFPMWSWQKLAPLKLLQKPLVMMECSIFYNQYLGLGYTQAAMDLMHKLRQRSLSSGGDFNMLWHNSHFLTPRDKDFFWDIIQ